MREACSYSLDLLVTDNSFLLINALMDQCIFSQIRHVASLLHL
ncbi:hypothetical protein SynSYN20_00712 [Synechococcus sp. SYN20]|nr:hypothetical protein SynSYN20_00712 [Synechococcus sp. SYN20]